MSATSPHGDFLERAVLFHVGILLFFATWAFGGNATWSHQGIMLWTLLGPVLTFLAVRRSSHPVKELRSLWPLLVLTLLVGASCFNPSFQARAYENETLLVHLGEAHPALPSTVSAAHTLDTWWFFAGIYLSCFNLTLLVQRRRALRGLLLFLTGNACVLAVFGSLQKLLGAKGLYFGLQATPQPLFFASFIYHNHWGTFIVIMTAALLGLSFYALKHTASRDFFHNPAFGGFIAALILAASVPLSASRSCTLLISILLLGALIHGLRLIVQGRASVSRGILLATLAIAASGAIYSLGKPVIDARFDLTREQIGKMRDIGGLGTRAILYHDTWRMAKEHTLFGWGMGSYALAFQPLFNSQNSIDGLPLIYLDAHSDWLQSLAELGFVGTALIALTGIVPLARLRRRFFFSPLVRYLLAGCGLVLLYAWIEFPFGNGAVVISFWICFFCAIRHARLDAPAKESA